MPQVLSRHVESVALSLLDSPLGRNGCPFWVLEGPVFPASQVKGSMTQYTSTWRDVRSSLHTLCFRAVTQHS